MKKIIFVLLTMLLLIVPLSANQTQRTKLSSDMRSMLAAMELIQKADFYNDHVMMKNGVKNLKNGLESLRSSDAKKYLPKNQAYADKFAQKRAKMIDMYADDILSSLKDKNMDDALEDYTQILKQCTSCHSRIRSY
jgi:cytochrome c556